MTLDFAGTPISTVSRKVPHGLSPVQNLCLSAFLLLIAGLTASCEGLSYSGANATSVSTHESISISPTTATVSSSGVKQFTATVSNISKTAVTWTASAGTISSTGLFTAPSVKATTQVSVTATSVANTSMQASATVTISTANTPPAVSISISPTTATVSSSGVQQFTATVLNTSNTAVTWTATAGAISSAGLFTAPSVTGTTQVSVTATSVADTSKQASATVAISPGLPPPPAILTSAVPNATIVQPYSAGLAASGGQPPYQWSVASGALPQGIQLNSASGVMVGSTSTTGFFSFAAKVTDAQQQSSTRSFTLLVADPNQPNTIPSSYFGMHLSDVTDWPAGYVGSLGKAVGTTWPYLEPSKGVFDWSRLDAYVQAAQANGVAFYYSNDYVPTWAAADPSSCYAGVMDMTVCTSTVANIQDWDDFVNALVTRYDGKIQMYELWNEPDQYFTGTVDQMVTLTNDMYSIVRSLDPHAQIASPSANDSTWLDSYWTAGGVKTVDIVSTHGYPADTNPVAEVVCAFRTLPLKALMAKYGIQKPIWDTEGSWEDLLPSAIRICRRLSRRDSSSCIGHVEFSASTGICGMTPACSLTGARYGHPLPG